MIAVIVLTHGNLAGELLEAARKIDEQIEQSSVALPLPWEIDSDEASELLRRTLKELDSSDGVLILTDMFGGTATNLALPFLTPDQVEVVTGVNLPMLVKLASLRNREAPLAELAARLTESGQKSIRVASQFLRNPRSSS